ncbi:hypothetical protein CP532_4774 [Ophiocordyceps camponoti-leonardi (nom. inval.)]|nr:hypothetical protein CP532_4774 [Ophiocordyceps camponoti-leonardi (nom. inval.)]
MTVDDRHYLFGGDKPWKATDWRASDDRVRKGKSQSYLTISPDGKTASFNGTLDTQTLGGAGFASQRTADEELCLDLKGYDGIVVSLVGCGEEKKKFALTLSDVRGEKRVRDSDDDEEEEEEEEEEEGGKKRDAAVLSWEAVFCCCAAKDKVVRLAWEDFVPTYRGREVKEAKPLDLSCVRRVGLMMRSRSNDSTTKSFFGEQSGEFHLEMRSIAAYRGMGGDRDVVTSTAAAAAASTSRHHRESHGPQLRNGLGGGGGGGCCGCDVDDALSLDEHGRKRSSSRAPAPFCCVMYVCLFVRRG